MKRLIAIVVSAVMIFAMTSAVFAAPAEVTWEDYQQYLIDTAGVNAPDLQEFTDQVKAIGSWEDIDQTVSPWDQFFTTLGLSTWEEFQAGEVKELAAIGAMGGPGGDSPEGESPEGESPAPPADGESPEGESPAPPAEGESPEGESAGGPPSGTKQSISELKVSSFATNDNDKSRPQDEGHIYVGYAITDGQLDADNSNWEGDIANIALDNVVEGEGFTAIRAEGDTTVSVTGNLVLQDDSDGQFVSDFTGTGVGITGANGAKIYADKLKAQNGQPVLEEPAGAVEPLEAPGIYAATKKNYDEYLYIHKYPAAGKEVESLAKILSASTLKHKREEFSVSNIRKGANALMKQPTFKQLAKDPARARKLLSANESDVVKGINQPFNADKRKQREVLTKLKNMAKQMDAPDGRTEKWAKLVNSLNNIDLDRDHTYEKQLTDIFKNNEDYMKGKKSIRRNQDGRNRFDQSLDVLSELAKVSDYAKDKAETLVDRINEVRKTKPGDRNGVSLSNYGADKQAAHVNEGHQRSVVEAAKRQQKQANNPQAGV